MTETSESNLHPTAKRVWQIMSSHEEQQRKNREEVLGRKRQWQAVGDSDEEQQRKHALTSLLDSESSESESSNSSSSESSRFVM